MMLGTLSGQALTLGQKSATTVVLLVEDNPGDARLIRELFKEETAHNFELIHVDSMGAAEKYLAKYPVDIILLDLGLPDAQGLEAVRRARTAAPRTPLVVLTGTDDETLGERTLQGGAQDYLVKGQINTRGLPRTLLYATARKRLEIMKDEFVASVSHELRTPLTSICGSLALIVGNAAGNLPAPASRLITIAHANCQRLLLLVNDILDVEKLESGQVVFNFRRVEVRSLVEQVLDANKGFAEAHGVRVRLEDGCRIGDVRADSGRLTQVITNLLSNAIKFSPTDGEVVVAIEKMPGVVRISVRDHGPGIPVEFRPHVFERFARADAASTRQVGGTGLGLSIVKQIVDRLGGEVSFSHAAGETIFSVDLPILDTAGAVSEENSEAAPLLRPEDRDAASVGSLRILHVDDDADIRELVEFALGLDPGFSVRNCASGKDALAVAADWSPDMILCDVMMPVMDGPMFLAQLRECPQTVDIPLIFVTARAQASDLEYFRQLGAQAVITKPFDPITLANSVRDKLAFGWKFRLAG